MALNPNAAPFIPDDGTPRLSMGQQISRMFQQVQEEEARKLNSRIPTTSTVVNKHPWMENLAKGMVYPIVGSSTNRALNLGTSLVGGAFNGISELIDRPKRQAAEATALEQQRMSEVKQQLKAVQESGRYVSYK